jgi:hypothetical protein
VEHAATRSLLSPSSIIRGAPGKQPGLIGTEERQARGILQLLVEIENIRAATTRASYMLTFTAELAPHLMSGLYPGSPAG